MNATLNADLTLILFMTKNLNISDQTYEIFSKTEHWSTLHVSKTVLKGILTTCRLIEKYMSVDISNIYKHEIPFCSFI